MAWNGSAVFVGAAAAAVIPLGQAHGLWLDASARLRFALFNIVVTPDRLAVGAGSYGLGEWTLGREVSGPGWPAGGMPCQMAVAANPDGSLALTQAAPLAATLVNIAGMCGDLLYDTAPPPAVFPGAGVGFHDYGGPLDVVAGTLTITWPASGIVVINAPEGP